MNGLNDPRWLNRINNLSSQLLQYGSQLQPNPFLNLTGGMRGYNAPNANLVGSYPMPSGGGGGGGFPYLPVAGGAIGGVGLIGSIANLFGEKDLPDLPYSAEDIDKLISEMRSGGYARVGGELGRANVQTAGQLASRGLGGSSMTAGALQANRAQATQALGQLESTLTQQQMSMLRDLYQMELQREMMGQGQKQDFWSSLVDIGGSLLGLGLL